MEEELLALLTLLRLEGFGPAHARKLRQVWGSLAELWRKPPNAWPLRLQKYATELKALRETSEQILQHCQTLGIRILPFWAAEFPPLLHTAVQPPAILYYKGTASLTDRLFVAVVGTRKPSVYGLKATEYFVEALVGAGIGIVSGLAYGIDAQAHRSALAHKGVTLAVLAHGMDYVYPPAHRKLAEAILQQGAWLSEYPPGVKPHPLHFPFRNRIMAALAQATLVIESREKGGALFTARMAFEANRLVYAVPGDIFAPTTRGTHGLIAEQVAQIAYDPAVILKELQSQGAKLPLFNSPPPQPSDPLQRRIYDILQEGPKHIDEVSAHLACPIPKLLATLVEMEVAGWICQRPGGFLIRQLPPDAIS
ncbi:MAG: DNA-processing protein DprA [Bacteroidia bacterium]|nr:DNA-processing protein DprA [Bacteroidia bacterium]MDW8088649.1 DNA-processing protein DprA [Bacteroidia bacterium]